MSSATRKRLIIAAGVLLGVPALLGLLLLAFVAAVQTPAGERWLARTIGGVISDPVDRVEIAGLRVSWPLDLTAATVTIADPQGTWLVLQGVTLDWQPSRLLSGLFAAERVAIDDAEMLRRPIPTEDDKPFKLPGLPIAVAIEDFAATLRLDPGVVGEPVTVAAGGTAILRPGNLDVALDVRRQGATGNEGTLTLDYQRGSGVLTVDVSLSRPVTALLAGLAGVPRVVPAMDLKIAGSGPLSDWRGTILGDIGPQICIEGDMRISQRAATDVLLDVAAVPNCIPDAEIQDLLAGMPVTLRAQVSIDDGSITRIAEARLRSILGSASLSGTLAERLGARFAVEIPEIERLAQAFDAEASGAVQASGTVTGSLERPVIEATLNSGGGAVGAAAWSDLEASLQLVPRPDGWRLGGRGAVTPATPPVEGLPAGPITFTAGLLFEAERDLYRLAEFRVDGGAVRLSAYGTVGGDGTVRLRGMTRLPDLRALRPVAGIDLAGRATAHFAVSGTTEGPHLSVALTGTTAGFHSGLPEADPLLGPAPAVSAAAVIRGGEVPVLRVALDGAKASLTAGGSLTPALALGWRLELPDLAALPVEELAGAAVATGIVTGPLAAPVVGGVIDGAVQRSGESFAVKAAIGARDLAATPRGAVHIGLRGDDLLAEVATDYELGDAIALRNFELFSRDSRLAGDLLIRDGKVIGQLAGRIADLTPWGALAGVEMAGGVDLRAEFGFDQAQTVAARLEGAGLLVSGTTLGRLHARLDVSDPLGQPRGVLKAEAAEVVTGGTALSLVELSAQSDNGEEIALRLNAAGVGEQPMRLSADGTLRLEDETQTLRLAGLSLSGGGTTARLVEPARITNAPDGITLTPLTFDVAGGGRIALSGAVKGEDMDLHVALARAPLALLRPYLPEQELTGSVTAQADITGTTASPVVVLDATGRGVGVAGEAGESLDIALAGRWENQIVALTADAKGARGTTATLEARLPLTSDFAVPEDGALQGRLRADGDLGRLTAALPVTGMQLAGALQADLRLAGTPAEPRLSGTAALRDGRIEIFETGTQLREVTAELVARDTSRAVITVSAVDDRGKGRITGQGEARWLDSGTAWDVALTVQDFRVINLDGAQARASGQLAFAGEGSEGALTGAVQIGPAEYHLTQGVFGGSVPVLDVREINRPGPVEPPQAPADPEQVSTPMVIALSVETTIERLFVRGDGLETIWRGDLVIGGTLEDPTVVGSVNAVRGTYALIGKQFALTDTSQVVFDGGAEINPRLDIAAEATNEDITAVVNVTGTVDSPKLAFSSVPSLPQDEILARLLFGSSVGELSTGQQLEIARAVTALSGGGSFDPVGQLRTQLGLDLLDVGVAEDGDGVSPSVSVGKYLDDDTFVRVEEGMGDEEGSVTVERRIGRGLSLEAEVGREGSGGVGLNWRMDY